MPRYLVTYEIGFASQQGHIAGHAFVDLEALTQANLDALEKQLQVDQTKTLPPLQKLVWRSITRLES